MNDVLRINMADIKQLEQRVSHIEKRNKKVELDKKWETSLSRKIIIAVLTYIVIAVFFYFAGLPKPFVNSIVPAAAFILSTLSLPYFKVVWKKLR